MSPLSKQQLEQVFFELAPQGPANPTRTSGQAGSRPGAGRTLGWNPEHAGRLDLKGLEEAISHVSADVPRGSGTILDEGGVPAEDYWLGVILAIRREFGPAGEELARKWSMGSHRYTAEGFDKDWGAYDPDHPNPVTIRSVYKLAQEFGWSGTAPTSSPRPVACSSRYRLLDRDAIMAIPPIEWRVKGLFPTTGVVTIYGPSSSGKSFLVLDLAINLALGRRWFGLRTKACDLTYVMLEGEAGLQTRLKVWEKHNGTSIPSNFRAITQPFSFANQQDVEDLAATLPKSGTVIIDTLNRAAPGADENSSKDMGDILKGMKQLQDLTQGLVMFVHHTGKDESRGMRGHSSLYAALDGAIEVQRKGDRRSWNIAKAKDGVDGQEVAFKLHVLKLGTDVDGEDISSCAIGPDVGAVPARKEPTGNRQIMALKTLRRALSISEHTGMAGCGPQTQCMKVDDAVILVADTFVTLEKKRRLYSARVLVQKLLDERYLTSGFEPKEEAWLWYV